MGASFPDFEALSTVSHIVSYRAEIYLHFGIYYQTSIRQMSDLSSKLGPPTHHRKKKSYFRMDRIVRETVHGENFFFTGKLSPEKRSIALI